MNPLEPTPIWDGYGRGVRREARLSPEIARDQETQPGYSNLDGYPAARLLLRHFLNGEIRRHLEEQRIGLARADVHEFTDVFP